MRNSAPTPRPPDPQAADDLVQETLIRVMNHLLPLEQPDSHQRRYWLYQTLRSSLLDRRRARLREVALMERYPMEAEPHAEPDKGDVEADLFDLDSESHREVLEMRYVLGMNSREIGEELGIPAATVRPHLRLAIEKLRARKCRLM